MMHELGFGATEASVLSIAGVTLDTSGSKDW